MADNRCPICGSPVPPDAEACPICGSPLEISGEPAEDLPDWLKELRGESATPADAEPAEEVPDWLAKIRDRAKQDQDQVPAGEEADGTADWLQELSGTAPAEEPADRDDADWLSRLSPDDSAIPAGGEETPGGEAREMPVARADDVTDWLKQLRDEDAGQAEPPVGLEPEVTEPGAEEVQPVSDLTDWLSHLDGETPAEEEPAAEIPAEETLAEGETPDWLSQFQPQIPAEEEPAAEIPAEEPLAAGETPDWLSQFQPETPAEEPAAEIPAEEPLATGETPDWLSQFQPETPAEEPAAEIPAEEPLAEGETPDWLSQFQPQIPAEEEPAAEIPVEEPLAEGETSDWLSQFQPETPAEEPAAEIPTEEPLAAGETPDWISRLESSPSGSEAEPVEAMEPISGEEVPAWIRDADETQPSLEAEPALELPGEGELPDWLSFTPSESAGEAVAGEEGIPAWMDAPVEPTEDAGIPAGTPSWLGEFAAAAPPLSEEELDEEGEPVSAFVEGSEAWLSLPEAGHIPETTGMEDLAGETSLIPPFLSDEVPEWLGQESAEGSPVEEAESLPTPPIEEPIAEGEPSLEMASLPTWLEAMRPVEAVAPAHAPTVQEKIERVGPLAGMQGVLPGEETAVQYHKPPTYSGRLRISETQRTHADVLQEAIQNLVQPKPIAAESRLVPQTVTRLLVTILILLVMLIPILGGTRASQLPAATPAHVSSLFTTLHSPAEAPQRILLAVEYEAGLAGEMQIISTSVLEDLVKRNAQLAVLSTQPTGVALAESLLQSAGVSEDAVARLGYLPGSELGLQSLTQDLRVALPSGNWDHPLVREINSLDDFDAILVISSNADISRGWLEQVQPAITGKPILMITSAQSAPILQPYLQSRQLSGMIGGLIDGAAYDRLTGRTDGAARRAWDSYQFGLILVILLIILGGLFQSLARLLPRRKPRKEVKA